MYYYFLFRKIIFSLLVLAGLGVLVLLVRFYWDGSGEQPITRVPVPPPTSQEKVVLAPAEQKAEPAIRNLAKSEGETKTSSIQESSPPISTTPAKTPEPVPKISSSTVATNSPPPVPVVESKAPTSAPKETGPKNEKKAAQKEKAGPKNKSVSQEYKKSEDKNGPSVERKTVTVKAGDSIYAIAKDAYRVSNTSVVDRILAVNPKIADPDRLPVEMKIKLPEISEESLIISSSDSSVSIRLGTFTKAEYASFLRGNPILQGKEVKVVPWKTPSGKTLYRATAGKFENREEGLRVIRELKEKGLSPYFEGFQKKN